MSIVDTRSPIPALRIALVHISYPGDILPRLVEPHVFVPVRRNEDDANSIRYAIVHAIRSGKLELVPSNSPNFETAAIKAAYNLRGTYKGSRSVLRGYLSHVPLIACYAFYDMAARTASAAPTVDTARSPAVVHKAGPGRPAATAPAGMMAPPAKPYVP